MKIMHTCCRRIALACAALVCRLATGAGPAASAATVLVEAESCAGEGGRTLDTHFIQEMGSPHLLAHALGMPGDGGSPRR